MSAESLIEYLNLITPLSASLLKDVNERFTAELYKPHQILNAPGQTENRVWFIERGFARAYYFDKSGKEHTLIFYNKNDFIFSYHGLWKETSDFYIEVLEESRLLSVPYDQITVWIDKFPEMKILVDAFARQRFHQEQFKSRLMTWSAEERYREFRKVNPEIFRKASLRLIASYLNMTRENLSRLLSRE